MATPQESREEFIDSLFNEEELEDLKRRNLYGEYVKGHISIDTIYNQLKDQGI
jgi:hypothetical protein